MDPSILGMPLALGSEEGMAAWDLHVEQLRVSWADFWEEISTGISLLIHSYNK